MVEGKNRLSKCLPNHRQRDRQESASTRTHAHTKSKVKKPGRNIFEKKKAQSKPLRGKRKKQAR